MPHSIGRSYTITSYGNGDIKGCNCKLPRWYKRWWQRLQAGSVIKCDRCGQEWYLKKIQGELHDHCKWRRR